MVLRWSDIARVVGTRQPDRTAPIYFLFWQSYLLIALRQNVRADGMKQSNQTLIESDGHFIMYVQKFVILWPV